MKTAYQMDYQDRVVNPKTAKRPRTASTRLVDPHNRKHIYAEEIRREKETNKTPADILIKKLKSERAVSPRANTANKERPS
jgi:hypothetical protein